MSLIGDVKPLQKTPVELQLGVGADAHAHPDSGAVRGITGEPIGGIDLFLVELHPGFHENVVDAHRFRIFGDKRPLLRHRRRRHHGNCHREPDRSNQHVVLCQKGAEAIYHRRRLSSRIVTGPSFTSSTCMCAWNSPRFHLQVVLPQRAHEIFVERPRHGGRGGGIKRRTPAFPAVAAQRELRHHQQRAAGVGHRTVHLLLRILKDAKIPHLSGDVPHIFCGVSLLHAREDRRPRPISPMMRSPTRTRAEATR